MIDIIRVCKLPTCENAVPDDCEYCCPEHRALDKRRQQGQATRDALRQYYPVPTRPAFNRINSSKTDRS